ncbi:preprotein translocase subunit YajC [Candidatus Acetothermia bacterium]|jgi:preprotein translocase subunit YajC|nr:preprotein translocase subunit YajC [Candidatus Acetothermia bacterium]MCI2432286.1 preprotein translocase subunit YajC [Candidatus Acetothermia bacterium]MCI2437411.1 preprotein translocase subunit YajC [Candidatus Acetothermia bacterium]
MNIVWLFFQDPSPAPAAPPEGPGWIFSLLMFAVMGVVFYFFLIRPQRKRQLEHQVLLESLRRGDEVVTIGGVWGRIVKLDKEHAILQVNEEGTTLRVLKESIAQKEKAA